MALAKTKENLETLLKLTEKVLYEEKSIDLVSLRLGKIFRGHGENASVLLDMAYAIVLRDDNPLLVAESLSQYLRGQIPEAYTAVCEQAVLALRAVPYTVIAETVLQDGFDVERYASFSALTRFISKNYGLRTISGDSAYLKVKLFQELYQGKFKGLAFVPLREALENHTDVDLDIDLKLETRIMKEKSFVPWVETLVSEVQQVELIPIAFRKEIKQDLRRSVGSSLASAYLELAEAKPRILHFILKEGYLKDFLTFFQRRSGNFSSAQVRDSLHHFLVHAENMIQVHHGAGEEACQESFRTSLQKLRSLDSFEDLWGYFRESVHSVYKDKDEHMVKMRDNRTLYEKIASVFAMRSVLLTESSGGLTTSCALPVSASNTIQLPEFVRCLDTEEQNQDIMRFFLYLQAGMGRFHYWGEKNKMNGDLETFSTYSNPDFARALFSSLAYGCVLQDIERDLPRLGKQLRKTGTLIKERYEVGSLFDETVQKYEHARELIEQHLVLGLFSRDSSLFQNLVPYLDDVRKETLDQKVEEIYAAIDTLVGIPPQTAVQSAVSSGSSQRRVLRLHEQTGSSYSGQVMFHYREGIQNVRLIEMRPDSSPNLRVQDIRKQNAQVFEKMRVFFETLKPQKVIHETRVYDGEIDYDLYLDALQDARAGFSPDTNVFRNRLVRDRDNAILLSTDLPRKIMTPLAKAQSGKQIQLDYIRQTLVTMADVFAVMEDDFAVMSYGSRGAEEVFVNVLKDFSEPYDTKVEHRMGMIAPILHSRTGSVYHRFADMLSERPAVRKIHIDIVSQLAQDLDYKRPESIAMAARGASIERAAGIELFALCLDKTASTEMLRDVYGSGHFICVQDLQDLDRLAIQLYKILRFQA